MRKIMSERARKKAQDEMRRTRPDREVPRKQLLSSPGAALSIKTSTAAATHLEERE